MSWWGEGCLTWYKIKLFFQTNIFEFMRIFKVRNKKSHLILHYLITINSIRVPGLKRGLRINLNLSYWIKSYENAMAIANVIIQNECMEGVKRAHKKFKKHSLSFFLKKGFLLQLSLNVCRVHKLFYISLSSILLPLLL